MDDILFNIGRERAKATINGIKELALTHQILYFNCHPYFVELFFEVDKNISAMEISEVKNRSKTIRLTCI